jgi:hypothetical protein
MENPLGTFANCCESFERFLLHEFYVEGVLGLREKFEEKSKAHNISEWRSMT